MRWLFAARDRHGVHVAQQINICRALSGDTASDIQVPYRGEARDARRLDRKSVGRVARHRARSTVLAPCSAPGARKARSRAAPVCQRCVSEVLITVSSAYVAATSVVNGLRTGAICRAQRYRTARSS
jgi:hypothetical protein